MTFREALRAAGKAYLERLMEESRGKVEAAAMTAGVTRQRIYQLADQYGINLVRRQYRKRVPNSDRARVKSPPVFRNAEAPKCLIPPTTRHNS